MQFLSLLGKKLKDDEMIEVLEAFDMKVIYDFDRLHEGQPDAFWTESKPDGFQFRFDDSQTLDTVFLHIAPTDGFAAISPSDCDVPLFDSTTEAKTYGATQHSHVTTGTANFLGVERHWVRIDTANNSTHYEFRSGVLALVTISQNEKHRAT